MDSLSKDELKALMQKHEGLCISVFMPTYRTGVEIQQNQIRLKNLLKEVEEKLVASGLRAQEIEAMLAPASGLVNNILFWRRQSDGLAIFISSDLFRYYRLPADFDELIVITDRFHVKPLLHLLGSEVPFYILALSQNEVRILEGSKRSIRELDLESIPKSLAAALQHDEPEKQIRFRAGQSGGGSGNVMVSGHGAEIDDTKDNLLKYFRQIDKGLKDLLKDERAPLVLAGVDFLFPIYKEANTYPGLMDEGIPGNPKGMSPEKLHPHAWRIVKPYFKKDRNDALDQFRQSSGTGLTSKDMAEIIQAAHHGRVGMLFLAIGHERWGVFDPQSGKVQLHKKMAPGNEDLLDLAAIQTFLNGGKVFTLPPEKMPDNVQIAAVFRY
ncbi:MAG: hypothetical protein JW943_07270 [Deltaproteobacteria bacterium]|nr:hypothetical protein [Deltaproteobacteria bacterium]